MAQRLWRAGKVVLGVLLLVLGFVGLFLPLLQGVLFLIMGLTLLSTESPRAKAWLEYLQERARLRKRPTTSNDRPTEA